MASPSPPPPSTTNPGSPAAAAAIETVDGPVHPAGADDDAPSAFDPFDDPEPDEDTPVPGSEAEAAIDASTATLMPPPSPSPPLPASRLSIRTEKRASSPSAALLPSPIVTAASSAATTLQHLSVQAATAADAATYIDPTPATPLTASHPPSRSPSAGGSGTQSPQPPPPPDADHQPPRQSMDSASAASPTRSDDKRYISDDDAEIHTIMDQFSADGGGPDAEAVMSPRLELAAPMLSAASVAHHQHPPRKSSLEPLAPSIARQIPDLEVVEPTAAGDDAAVPAEDAVAADAPSSPPDHDQGPPVPPKDTAARRPSPALTRGESAMNTTSPTAAASLPPLSPTVSLHRPPPPEPEPEPVLAFDFHRFLEQLRHKKADPVARYLKSFLSEFGKRQWMVHEQVKIISDFLAFIANKMAVCEVWRDLSDAEFDNAREGMEKLVMNRLYTQTFSPAIPPPQPLPASRGAAAAANNTAGGSPSGSNSRRGRAPDRSIVMGPGRRGQHQEDVERDEVLSQKIKIYGWIREPHLDIPPVADSGRRFLKLAQQELLKIRSYRAPRDKIVCVLNCCKVIFGLLKHTKSDASADSFMPLLIYVVLQANPDHLVSNVQYILRFRNQDKLGGEAGYYLSSLMGVIQFIENMDRTTLTISDDEFETNVEAAVSAIAEKHRAASPPLPPPPPPEEDAAGAGPAGRGLPIPPGAPSSASSFASGSASRPARSVAPGSTDGDEEEKDAITGLLRTIQRPLTTIGRMFSDEASAMATATASTSLTPPDPNAATATATATATRPESPLPTPTLSRRALSAEEAAARQTSAETAEAQRIQRVEHANVVETLAGMFPNLDRDVISDVVYQKEGRVGLAVDACLALSA